MLIVEVLIEYATHSLNRPFSYLYSGDKKIAPGFRVLINFNHKKIVGYVTKIIATEKNKKEIEEEYGFDLEEIIDVIDEAPLLNDDLLILADQLTEKYLSPKINILQTMLPPSLSPRRGSLRAPKISYDKYLVPIDDDEEGLTPKQIEILRLIVKNEKVLKREIKSVEVVKKLIEKGKIEEIQEEKRRLSIPDFEYREAPILTHEQQSVVDEFLTTNDQTYLLQGVTGSGKTEVYLSICEKILKEGKDVLMLVPEISLTPMISEYFLRRFKNNVAILHSELTPSEKYDEYRKIAKGDCHIVVGVRSAIFAPLKNIGLIILDEEHVESYKQDTPPFYHAREVALMRAKMHKAKVILGSATPSLESKARAQKGVYHYLELKHRINKQELPKTTIVNLADYRNIDRDSSIFSIQLRQALKDVLDQNEQAILLMNRRGFSTSVTCRSCGHTFRCPDCGIALTYHKSDNLLKCHYCNHVEALPEKCPECGNKYFRKSGLGTEKVEEEILRLFPQARVLRLDSDSSKVRTNIRKIVESFRKKEADILVGTQMIAKGHDFPGVTLVGIVLADIGLNIPDCRSSERVFQLIMQGVGRSGRGDRKGVAIIQTYNPNHYAITFAARQDYELFYKKEMFLRRAQGYPPYYFLAGVSISSKNETAAINAAYDAADYLNDNLKDKAIILGPTTPLISGMNSTFVRHILVKHKDEKLIANVLEKLIANFANQKGIKIEINIDPYNF